MNSKEALRRIYNDAINMNEIEEDVEEIKNDYHLIKQDLDRLEQIEKERQEVETWLSSKETNTFDEIATMIKKASEYDKLLIKYNELKKALDILINKNVYIYGIKPLSSVKQYNNIIIGTEFNKLTKEEYELLKSVLEEE